MKGEIREATITRGPGRAPEAGAPPFLPRLTCTLQLQSPFPAGATVRLRPLRADEASRWLKHGQPSGLPAQLHPGSTPLTPEVRAEVPAALAQRATRLGLEVRKGKRVLLRAEVAMDELFLPSAAPRSPREEDR